MQQANYFYKDSCQPKIIYLWVHHILSILVQCLFHPRCSLEESISRFLPNIGLGGHFKWLFGNGKVLAKVWSIMALELITERVWYSCCKYTTDEIRLFACILQICNITPDYFFIRITEYKKQEISRKFFSTVPNLHTNSNLKTRTLNWTIIQDTNGSSMAPYTARRISWYHIFSIFFLGEW